MYAVYHGPNRLSSIARTIHKSTAFLASSNFFVIQSTYIITCSFAELKEHGIRLVHDQYFDTLKVKPKNITDFRVRSELKKINVRHFNDGHIGISLDETVLPEDIADLLHVFEINYPTVSILWQYYELTFK